MSTEADQKTPTPLHGREKIAAELEKLYIEARRGVIDNETLNAQVSALDTMARWQVWEEDKGNEDTYAVGFAVEPEEEHWSEE